MFCEKKYLPLREVSPEPQKQPRCTILDLVLSVQKHYIEEGKEKEHKMCKRDREVPTGGLGKTNVCTQKKTPLKMTNSL